jgi:hypothetical protein
MTLRSIFLFAALISELPAASVHGVVYDASGAVVPAAGATLLHAGTGAKQTVTTADVGSFSFTGLPAGEYRLEVAKPGFMLYTRGLGLDAE